MLTALVLAMIYCAARDQNGLVLLSLMGVIAVLMI